MNIYTKETKYKDITSFSNGCLNGWVPRLPEYDQQGKPNWAVTEVLAGFGKKFDHKVLFIPTQDMDNSGTIISKLFNFKEGAVYKFSVTISWIDSYTAPQLSLCIGAEAQDSSEDKVICHGMPVSPGEEITFTGLFQADSAQHYLKIYNSVATGIGNDFAITMIIVEELFSSDCCGDNPQGGRQNFGLPANINFGLNALINSSVTQTIKVFIDDQLVDSLSDSGIENKNPGAKIYNSKSGKVGLEVWANGKVSGLKYANNPLNNKPGIAILATEDYSDNDYNDTIVILNWPLR